MSEFLDSRYAIYVITALIFLALGYFLRFLFGPKGVFKDEKLSYDNEIGKENTDK